MILREEDYWREDDRHIENAVMLVDTAFTNFLRQKGGNLDEALELFNDFFIGWNIEDEFIQCLITSNDDNAALIIDWMDREQKI